MHPLKQRLRKQRQRWIREKANVEGHNAEVIQTLQLHQQDVEDNLQEQCQEEWDIQKQLMRQRE